MSGLSRADFTSRAHTGGDLCLKKTLNKKADAKYHRIDDTQRNKIQFALDNRIKLADIAKELELPSSTVSREIARHLEIIPSKHNECL